MPYKRLKLKKNILKKSIKEKANGEDNYNDKISKREIFR